MKIGCEHADAVVLASHDVKPKLAKWVAELDKPVLEFPGEEDFVKAYSDFYYEISPVVEEEVVSE